MALEAAADQAGDGGAGNVEKCNDEDITPTVGIKSQMSGPSE